MSFVAEDFYYLLSADRLLDITVDGTEGGLLCGEILLALARHKPPAFIISGIINTVTSVSQILV